MKYRQLNNQSNKKLFFVFLADRPDPLRLPEVIIVIAVLLLWCGSILIFIRHSELLRIRHRDIPYHSSIKAPMALNHMTLVNRASDMTIHGKSHVSSMGGLTPPMSNPMFRRFRNGEPNETISLIVSPVFKKRRHTHSFDFHASSPSTKYSSEKNNYKEHFLHPYRISSDIKQSFHNLNRKSIDNLSNIKHPTFYSANDILRHKPTSDSTDRLLGKKRCIHESPV
jgi:hypothetical protein